MASALSALVARYVRWYITRSSDVFTVGSQHNRPMQSVAFAVPLLPGQTEADRIAVIYGAVSAHQQEGTPHHSTPLS
jgi:hypothetical protein